MIPFFLTLVFLIFGSFVFQFFLPPVLLLNGAAILFAPALYFYGCLSLPFPLMLALTFVTGLLNDLGLSGTGVDHARVETSVSQASMGTALAAGGNRRRLDSVYFSRAIRYC
jgi:hypothetical protein